VQNPPGGSQKKNRLKGGLWCTEDARNPPRYERGIIIVALIRLLFMTRPLSRVETLNKLIGVAYPATLFCRTCDHPNWYRHTYRGSTASKVHWCWSWWLEKALSDRSSW